MARTTKRKTATTKTTKHKTGGAHPCACGCSQTTARTFAQGHDSKAFSLLRKVGRGELKASDIPATLRTADLKKDSEIARLLRKVTV